MKEAGLPDQPGGAVWHPDGQRPAVVIDVARRAGVSTGTVSNVINRPEMVSEPVRQRVQAAIAELGYVRNHSAQVLRSGVASVVGVTILDMGNPFFIEAATGMERRLAQDSYLMLLTSSHNDADVETHLLQMLEMQSVRGIILAPVDMRYAQARRLVRRGMNVVIFDPSPAPRALSSVALDNHTGSRLVIKHLTGLGHRRIAFLVGPHYRRATRDRTSGVKTAMAGVPGAELTVIDLDSFTAQAGFDGTCRLLKQCRPLPTAIFCANDLIAVGAIQALREADVKVPADISVVGFDDIPIAAQLMTPLTTVRQPMEELGWTAADMLLSKPAAVRHALFPPELIIRQSTAPPAQ
jgi:LacI family transcriptional regulator